MANDLWRTPPEVYNTLDQEFAFVADMACTRENRLCEIGFTEEDDSLNFCWAERVREMCPQGRPQYVWCNPPYSDPKPWVKQALEAQLNGLGVVMLLNNDTSVGWFAEALKGASEIRHIIADEAPETKRGYTTGRLAFLNNEGEPVSGNNKPQFVIVFNPFKIAAHVTSYVPKSELYGVR